MTDNTQKNQYQKINILVVFCEEVLLCEPTISLSTGTDYTDQSAVNTAREKLLDVLILIRESRPTDRLLSTENIIDCRELVTQSVKKKKIKMIKVIKQSQDGHTDK